MRRLIVGCAALASLVACGDDSPLAAPVPTAAPTPQSGEAAPAPELAAEGLPAAPAVDLLRAVPAAVAVSSVEGEAEAETTAPPAELDGRIREALADIAEEVMSVEALGTVALPSGEAHVSKAIIRDDTEEALYLAIVLPGGDALVRALGIGTTEYLPGNELETVLDTFGTPSADGNFLRAEFSTRESYSEFATDGECQQRDQAPTTVTGWTLICGSDDCVAIRRTFRVASPGFEQNCAGRHTSTNPGPDPYEIAVAVEDAEHVRLSLVRGSLDTEELGVIAFGDLDRDRAVRAY